MLRRAVRLFAILPLVATAWAGPGIEDIPAYPLGIDAISGRLWDVAATRFEQCLATPELDPPVRQALLLRLAEAQIRGRQVEAATKTLEDPLLADHPELAFWKSQSLVMAGRFREAIEILESEASLPKTPHRREALLTLASLQRAIGNTGGALETVEVLLKSNSSSTRALLLKAGLLLDGGNAEQALKVIPNESKLSGQPSKEAAFLRAQALLATEQFEDAATIFNSLIESPKDQTLGRYHGSFIGLAKARLAIGIHAAAADGLLAFIQQNPRSPRLHEAFGLLMECIPAQPTPNDAILTRIREWVPTQPDPNPLAPEAMFHLALGLRREGSAESRAIARQLLTRVRLMYPEHQVVARSLLEAGRWDLEDGRREQAAANFATLDALVDARPELRAFGMTLEGSARFTEGDYEGAAEAYNEASILLDSDQRSAARLNAATSLLASDNIAAFDELSGGVDNPGLQSHLSLERGLYLASKRDPAALAALRAFIENHPGHPRLPEARLNAALAAVNAIPPDTDFARAQLLALDEKSRAELPPTLLALAEIQLFDRLADWTQAASIAEKFLAAHPEDPMRHAILFEQGKALFQNKDYNAARLVLEELASQQPDSIQAPAALLLSARAAAEGATPQSQTESIALFDKLIDSDSPFADVARLEKANMLIHRLSRLDDAIAVLEPWFRKMKKDEPLLLSVGLLLGEALYARAGDDSESLNKALEIYDRLLSGLPANSPSRSRILYLKGRTLEQFEQRESEALVCYMDVIQTVGESPRTDWKSVELCGFSALRILEKREQWRAAKMLATDIAKLNGPRAKEAEERAKTLGLEHMIWDDSASDPPAAVEED